MIWRDMSEEAVDRREEATLLTGGMGRDPELDVIWYVSLKSSGKTETFPHRFSLFSFSENH